MMDKKDIDKEIDAFMHSTVFTGRKPLFLVAEELAIEERIGDSIDAVWVDWEDESKAEFTYITKFAVRGNIIDRHYYPSEKMAPFKGRLALPHIANLEKMVLHRAIKKEIDEVKAQRYALAKAIKKDLKGLTDVIQKGGEAFLFKKGYGEWTDPFYEINIDAPYEIVETDNNTLEEGEYVLKHPRTGVIKKYHIENEFYAYIVGGRADIAGLQLKDESYSKKMQALKDEAKEVFVSIQWLNLDDDRIKAIKESLPKHPFENYFNYVKKGNEAKPYVSEDLLKALEIIVLKYMPKLNTPMGVEYIPIDNLLHLFHEIIPRADALLALEGCDIIHESSAVLLGVEGRRELPPKFLVSMRQVISVYKKFPSFIKACEQALIEDSES